MGNFSKKNRLNIGLNKVSDNLVNVCNEILVSRENDCNCFDSNNYPVNVKDMSSCLNKKNTNRSTKFANA